MAHLLHTAEDGEPGHSGVVPLMDVSGGGHGPIDVVSTLNRPGGLGRQPGGYPSALRREGAGVTNSAVYQAVSGSCAKDLYEPAIASGARTPGIAARGGAVPDIRILIVDDCTLHRENLAEIFAVNGATTPALAWDMPSLNDALGAAAPDIVLLSMLTRDSLTLLRSIRDKCPYTKVIVVGICDEDEPAIVTCAEAGVTGYHLRTESLDDLIVLILKVVEGESVCPPRVSAMLLRRLSALASHRPPAQEELELTAREAEILTMLKRGLSNREIAEQLCIAVHTVKNHVHSLLTKLGVSTRGQAAALAHTAK